MFGRKGREMNKILYYDNKVNYFLSPHVGTIPALSLLTLRGTYFYKNIEYFYKSFYKRSGQRSGYAFRA